MILTNILLAILVGLNFKKFFSKYKTDTTYSKGFAIPKRSEILPILQDIEILRNSLDAHKVFVAKTFSELTSSRQTTKPTLSERSVKMDSWKDRVIDDKNKKWGGGELNADFEKLTKSLQKKKKGQSKTNAERIIEWYGNNKPNKGKIPKKTIDALLDMVFEGEVEEKIIEIKKKKKKNKQGRYTDFQIHKEMIKHIKKQNKRGVSIEKVVNNIHTHLTYKDFSVIKDVDNIRNEDIQLYKFLRDKAYHRIWQKQNYKTKR
jgi:hypothetical protein